MLRGKALRTPRSSPVNIPSMAHSQDHDFLSFQIEYHSVLSDPEAIGAYSRICQLVGELQWLALELFKGLAHPLPHTRIEVLDIPECPLGIYKSVLQRPKASS